MLFILLFSGENVEEAFLETARKIYQNIQDGRYVKVTVNYLLMSLCFASGQFSGLVLFDSLHCLCSCGFMVALFFSTVSCVVDDVDDDDDDDDDDDGGDNDN